MNDMKPDGKKQTSKKKMDEQEKVVDEVARELHEDLKDMMKWTMHPGKLRQWTNYSEEEFAWVGRALGIAKADKLDLNWDWAKNRVKTRLMKCANTYAISLTFADQFHKDIEEIYPPPFLFHAIQTMVSIGGEYSASYLSGAIELGLKQYHSNMGFKYLQSSVPVTLRLPPEAQFEMTSDVIKKMMESLNEETKERMAKKRKSRPRQYE